MKKIKMVITFAVISVLLLSACSSGNSGTQQAKASMQAVESANQEEAKEEVEEAKKDIDYPKKAITVVVPFSAGGEHDMTARLIASRMEEMFGYTVIIQNTTGSAVASTEYMMDKNNTDGYRLFMHSPEVMASEYVVGSSTEPLYKDFTYLGCFVYDPMVICVKEDSPYNTLEDLLEAAKADPAGINWASVGSSGKNMMDAKNFWDMAGVEFNYVPYDDASKSRAAVLGGHDVVYHAYASGAKPSVDAGELKVLAIGAAERVDFWPDVPTLKEKGYDLEVGLTRCWDIHPDTDPAIIERITDILYQVWSDETTQQKLIEMGQSPRWMTDEEMHEYGEYYYGVYSEYSK